MAFFKKTRVANSEANQYASAEDFRQVFSEDRDVLSRLSLLLTDPISTCSGKDDATCRRGRGSTVAVHSSTGEQVDYVAEYLIGGAAC